MNDVSPQGLDSAETPSPTETAPTPGFGVALAQAREAQGISVADMATRLRLHPRQVTALEEERLDALPEAPFVRGFLRNYAKEVHLDPVPLLAALNAKLPAGPVIGDTLADSGISAAEVRRAGMEHTSRIAVIGGSVALLLVLGLIGWVASNRVTAPQVAAPQAPEAAPAPAPGGDRASRTPEAQMAPAPAAASLAPGQAEAPPPAAESKDTAAPIVAGPAATSTSAATPSTTAAVATSSAASTGSGGLRLVVGDRPSWVEITQADGRVLLTGLLEPGSERRLGNPQPPLQLVIGNASTVTLEYRGKAVDLQRHVRANDLARLSLE